MEVIMRDNYAPEEGTTSGGLRNGLYAMYCGKEHPAVYLGVGRFILYSFIPDENFTFPSQDGRYLLQTDLRDENLTRVYEVRMIGVIKECYESVNIISAFNENVLISTYNPRIGFLFGLKSTKEYGFIGFVDSEVLVGIYDERDYLWNPAFGICATLCHVSGAKDSDSWFAENDRISQLIRAK
jgi:hypothetical protein